MKNFLLSSADPTKVSMTIKGITGFLISLATVWLTMQGASGQATDIAGGLNQLADQIIVLIGLVSQFVFGAIAVYGLVRKLIYKLANPIA